MTIPPIIALLFFPEGCSCSPGVSFMNGLIENFWRGFRTVLDRGGFSRWPMW